MPHAVRRIVMNKNPMYEVTGTDKEGNIQRYYTHAKSPDAAIKKAADDVCMKWFAHHRGELKYIVNIVG